MILVDWLSGCNRADPREGLTDQPPPHLTRPVLSPKTGAHHQALFRGGRRHDGRQRGGADEAGVVVGGAQAGGRGRGGGCTCAGRGCCAGGAARGRGGPAGGGAIDEDGQWGGGINGDLEVGRLGWDIKTEFVLFKKKTKKAIILRSYGVENVHFAFHFSCAVVRVCVQGSCCFWGGFLVLSYPLFTFFEPLCVCV
jgi:hypothetical protein